MTWSADGDKHDRRCIGVAIIVGGAVTLSGQPSLGIKMAVTIITWGLLFSPDLDLADTGRLRGGGCKAWHRWKRMGLGWVWKPYGHAFEHRSPYTHSLIPGTLIRILYVLHYPFLIWLGYYFVALTVHIYEWDLSSLFNSLKVLKSFVHEGFVFLACCFIADAVHLVTDKIPLNEWFVD